MNGYCIPSHRMIIVVNLREILKKYSIRRKKEVVCTTLPPMQQVCLIIVIIWTVYDIRLYSIME